MHKRKRSILVPLMCVAMAFLALPVVAAQHEPFAGVARRST